ncbi:YqeG family HAD IIIA-type phosphatase [Deinococcus lacus]|uniref:YqeG family HAD IIIA-type phosphatase n=1 Tax=Deinococcus lacus TaxID=392561 RepID=A0ABW1YDP4_9DEIO
MRRYLCPDDVLLSLEQITPEFMAARGLRGLLLDLDNTLVPYGSREDRAETTEWLAGIRSAGLKAGLLSNAAGGRAAFWQGRLGLEGTGMAGKPNPRTFERGAARLGLPPYQVGMVGDQVFTDVLGGNLAGMHTILVVPLADNALPHTRLARSLERSVLRRYGLEWAGRAP